MSEVTIRGKSEFTVLDLVERIMVKYSLRPK